MGGLYIKTIFEAYTIGFSRTNDLLNDVTTFFKSNSDIRTLNHTKKVAEEAVRIANLYGEDTSKLEQAALLHDISNVVPVTNMLQTAEELSILILEEERKYSRIIHQKLSKVMAQEIFLIDDADILSAIECHTTLKSNSTMIDKILFISDKISFDLPGEHKYLLDIRSKVDGGYINDAILIYLNSIWEQRDKLKLIHPWLINAREELLLQV
ncbi:HD domain-containing protein [Cohnella laeviribosi]|uniref:HD domain-containing protein n=1 Tax=Cohnella laeviribosi TaxID=380174 RepID=UPI003D1C85E2